MCLHSSVQCYILVGLLEESLQSVNGGIYHVSAHHDELEDIRESILNYSEEGGGEQDQVRIIVLRYYYKGTVGSPC